jgi:hypothetical protein
VAQPLVHDDHGFYRVAPNDPDLLKCVESIARRANRPFRPLKLQTLLHLPGLAGSSGIVARVTAASLIEELAHELPALPRWKTGTAEVDSPRDLQFVEVGTDEARHIMGTFHYLRSPRTDGRAYGLSTASGAVIALAVSSPLDVEGISTLLRNAKRLGRARVISRLFVFEDAPKNSISYLLARASAHERCFDTTDLVTYVNPNMGFTGVSYRASGWTILGSEPGTRYKYVDGRYITDRQLLATFSTSDDAALVKRLGARFTSTSMRLMPLLIFQREIRP